MSKYTLLLKINESDTIDNENLIQYYSQFNTASEDSGLDLINPIKIYLKENKVNTINFNISCAMVYNKTGELSAYYLYPRSSFSKYPFVFGNHVGIIDAGYRGNIMAKIRYIKNWHTDMIQDNSLNENIKLFQLCTPDLSPFNVKIVSELPDSIRGEGGFGSTGQ